LNRNEEVEGVYSRHTALSLCDLSDLNPSKLHMTVPMDFRRTSDIPGILVPALRRSNRRQEAIVEGLRLSQKGAI
jgi:hypothetical protein